MGFQVIRASFFWKRLMFASSIIARVALWRKPYGVAPTADARATPGGLSSAGPLLAAATMICHFPQGHKGACENVFCRTKISPKQYF